MRPAQPRFLPSPSPSPSPSLPLSPSLTLTLTLLALLALPACGDDGGAPGTGHDASIVDADPNAPDSDPNAPDADPNAPDADPNAPDAATSCDGGQELCSGSCVDLLTDAGNCGGCGVTCGDGQSCVLGGCVTGVGSLVISELHARHPSYLELYNGGSAAIDLGGHLIQWNTDGSGSGSVALPSYSLAPHEFVVLREGAGTNAPGILYLGQDIGWRDQVAVRLLSPGGAGIDFVRTGNSVVTPPTGTTWTGPNAPNPSATIDQSLVRNVYVADTDSAADWRIENPSSPGAYCANEGRCGDACFDLQSDRANCGSCGFACGATQLCADGACRSGFVGLWISEYRRYPRPGIELHNPTATAVNMTGYRLDISGPTQLSFPFPDGFTLAPGAYVFVYMGTGETNATTLFTGPSSAFGPNVAIALYDGGTTALDFVRFGTSTAPIPSGTSWFGGNVTAPLMDRDEAARRNVLLIDSDSANDWVLAGPSTPGFSCYDDLSLCGGVCTAKSSDPDHCGACGNACGANETCASGVCSSSGGVKLSELRYIAHRGFELFNGGDTTVDLEGWTLEWAGTAVNSYTIQPGVTLAPGAFLLLYGAAGTSNASVIYMGSDKSVQWTDYIAVALKDASGTGVDFVRTGSSVTMPPSGTTWSGDNAVNPTGSSGSQSLVRQVWSADTNTAADWSLGNASIARFCTASADSVCAGECVNLQTDPGNCGACGNTCGTGFGCYQGACLEQGAVQLVATAGLNGIDAGRLEVFVDGVWRKVAGLSGSTGNDIATLACRQLGFSSGVVGSAGSDGCSSCGYIYNITCATGAVRLADCAYSTYTSSTYGQRITCAP